MWEVIEAVHRALLSIACPGGGSACPLAGVLHPAGAVSRPTGIALGIGGLAGAYTGARIQRRLPDVLIRRVMGILVMAIGARYLWSGLG